MAMKTDWETADMLRPCRNAMREQTWERSDWSEDRERQCIDFFKQTKSYEPCSDGFNHYRVLPRPKHNIQTVSTCYHVRGMQHYLCFLMPFFCGTDPLFWLRPSTSASLKLDSDPPSQDSSESKPEEERRLQLWHIWEQTLNHLVTEI